MRVPFYGDGSRPVGDEFRGLLGLISHSLLSKLTVLSLSDWHIQPPDTSSHIQPPDTSSHIQPPDTSSHIQPPDTSSHIQPPDTSSHIQPPDTSSHIQTADTSSHTQSPHTSSHIQPPDTSSHIQPPDTSSHDLTISMDLKNSEYYHQALEILLVKCDTFKRNHRVFVSIKSYQSQDLSTLIQKHKNKLKLCSLLGNSTQRNLLASGEFPYCPELTHLAVEFYKIDDSAPFALMKAVKDGKFPNLRRIEFRRCVLRGCEWPEVPEFYLFFLNDTSGTFQIQKLLFEVTELTVNCISTRLLPKSHTDCLISVRLEKLSVLKLGFSEAHNLVCLNNIPFALLTKTADTQTM